MEVAEEDMEVQEETVHHETLRTHDSITQLNKFVVPHHCTQPRFAAIAARPTIIDIMGSLMY